MFIEGLIIGGGVVAGRHALLAHRRQREAREAREASELWFRTIRSSQQIQATTSAARKAMLDEVRRRQRPDSRPTAWPEGGAA